MGNSIPSFSHNGYLPVGIHQCTGEEFLSRFCRKNSFRGQFYKAITGILDFAKDRNASHIFVGGSFVSNKDEPSDFDAVIVFRNREHIPSKGERLLIAGKKADIMFCSEDEPKIVDAFIRLFSLGIFEEEKGLVQINLSSDGSEWQIMHMPTEDELEIVKRAYTQREFIDIDYPEGILVTVHGLLSDGDWNNHLMPTFSSQGWTVAPFNYGYKNPTIMFDKSARKEVLENFRHWLYDIDQSYRGEISIIAHSFGTYIIGAYLHGFKETCPVNIQSIILTGSILTSSFDWDSCIGKIGRVRNEIAPNDQWVKWIPESGWLFSDPLFGNSGVIGFSNTSRILDQSSNPIFDHNNVIKKDVVNQIWLPYLQSNKGALQREYIANNSAYKNT